VGFGYPTIGWYHNHMTLIRNIIEQRLAKAVEQAQRRSVLAPIAAPPITVERPQKLDNGDFASNLPLRYARSLQMNPLAIAELLAPIVETGDEIQRVWVAPPGFLNFELRKDWLQRNVNDVIQAGEAFANTTLTGGLRTQIEFVSVNPTGPIHVGHARGAVLGSALANVLTAAGQDVTREYYVNDAGSQMDIFYESLYVRYAQKLGHSNEELPEGGYQGKYLEEIGGELASEFGNRFLVVPRNEGVKELGEIGLNRMLNSIEKNLLQLGVVFDVWFRERDLFDKKQYDTVMKLLKDKGFVTEREGATWFTSTSLGNEKDNVLVRGTGQPTYFASDAAYHYDKFSVRKFDRVINIWGADHQGHVDRLHAVVDALGFDSKKLSIIISQLVTLKRGDDVVRVSKRTGDLITLEELVAEVGSDACRFFFLSRSAESQMEFDLELAKKQSADNPVFYVQYAHARIAGILRLAHDKGINWEEGNVALLSHEAELGLIRKMTQLPEVVDTIAKTLQPHHLPYYSIELASAFHGFYDHCRVLSDDPEHTQLTEARLKLCHASKLVLAKTLYLMGMTAPEEM
jgi:arginyl-tRNA synthetase